MFWAGDGAEFGNKNFLWPMKVLLDYSFKLFKQVICTKEEECSAAAYITQAACALTVLPLTHQQPPVQQPLLCNTQEVELNILQYILKQERLRSNKLRRYYSVWG